MTSKKTSITKLLLFHTLTLSNPLQHPPHFSITSLNSPSLTTLSQPQPSHTTSTLLAKFLNCSFPLARSGGCISTTPPPPQVQDKHHHGSMRAHQHIRVLRNRDLGFKR
ncbi:hypothetical protein BC829DRAFT_282471 [Chytridium lagenaria]|nr:hypothetical protein BC829DRAFT_282471 [Chytridium lagenaria]